MTSGKRITFEERARVLELIDKGLTAPQIATRFGIHRETIYKIKKCAPDQCNDKRTVRVTFKRG